MVTTRGAPVNSITWLFKWLSSCKKAIITYHCLKWHTLFLSVWRLHAELTKIILLYSQLSYNPAGKIVK